MYCSTDSNDNGTTRKWISVNEEADHVWLRSYKDAGAARDARVIISAGREEFTPEVALRLPEDVAVALAKAILSATKAKRGRVDGMVYRHLRLRTVDGRIKTRV